jgi:hypothetical protein
MDSRKDTPCGVGCPIRRSQDQRVLAPPLSFSQRATSFIASRCQGIHQMPFSSQARPRPAHNPRLRAEEQNVSFAEAFASAFCIPSPGRTNTTAPTRGSPRRCSRARVCVHTVTSRCTMSNLLQTGGRRPLKLFFPPSPARPCWRRQRLVGLGRLERPTSRLSGVRSNQLSYRPGPEDQRQTADAGLAPRLHRVQPRTDSVLWA